MSSPRTPQEPMAFTPIEFGRGAVLAWCVFMALLLGALIVFALGDLVREGIHGDTVHVESSLGIALLVVVYAGFLGGAMGLVAMALGMPFAWLLGRSLRRVRRTVVHVLAYAAFGALAGSLAVGALHLSGAHLLGPLAISLGGVLIAVPTGWWFSARRALREDRGLITPQHPSLGPDEQAEDALGA